MIAGVVKQFWNETVWGDVDYLFVDMPPGTGDVPLTVFQSLPVDGIVIVTSPQELVQMIVKKAYNMAEMMHVPVLGLVENFSYLNVRTAEKRSSCLARVISTMSQKSSGSRYSESFRLIRRLRSRQTRERLQRWRTLIWMRA